MTSHKNNNSKYNNIENKQRRKIVGGTLTGAAAIVWHKPLVNSIVLPAHAQTSTAVPMTFFGAATPTTKSLARSVFDSLIPEAHAGIAATPVSIMASVEQLELDGTEFMVTVLVDLGSNLSSSFETAQLTYSGMLTLGVASTLGVSEDPCEIGMNNFASGVVPDLNATLDSVTEDQAIISGGNDLIDSGTVSIPAGSGSLMSAICTETVDPTAFALKEFQGALAAKSEMIEHDSFASVVNSVLDTVIPSAHAGQDPTPVEVFSASAVLADRDANTYTVTLQSETKGVRWVGTLDAEDSLNAQPLQLDQSATCVNVAAEDETLMATIFEQRSLSINGPSSILSINLSVMSKGVSQSLPPSTTPLETPEFCLTVGD